VAFLESASLLLRSPALAKAEGMVRFCRAGRRPLAQQPWPAALLDVSGVDAGDAAAS
jgi:hypothetical protein